MFANYREIFNKRGAAYHEAMDLYPRVRDEEFAHVLAQARIGAGQLICDVPSGGGYLADRIPASLRARVFSVETSAEFFAARDPSRQPRRSSLPVLCSLDALPLRSGVFDVVVSVAGLHHVEDKRAFCNEARRLLRPGGRLCIADVGIDSGVARFLDGFVAGFSSTGHRGAYLDPQFRDDLRDCGFAVEHDAALAYPWTFPSRDALAEFCGLLFGLDCARPDQIVEAVRQDLGFEETGGAVRMNWELVFVTAVAGA